MLLQKLFIQITDPMKLAIFEHFMATLTLLNNSLFKIARFRVKKPAKEKPFAGRNENG